MRSLLFALALVTFASPLPAQQQRLRPPAVPLVTHDPYFSVWSCSDQLAADWPRHWTGAVHALSSMVRVDGKTYRLMGLPSEKAPPAVQRSLRVLPTRTIYEFEAGGVRITLTFTTPLLPDSPDLVSRPVTYLTWTAVAADGQPHDVAIYYDNSAELVVNQPDQKVTWSRPAVEGLTVLQFGSQDQPVLQKEGDNVRIDWGYLDVAIPEDQKPQTVIATAGAAREGFVASGRLPGKDDEDKPRAADSNWPVCACAFELGRVGGEEVSRWLMLAYDDVESIQFLGKNLRAWWRRNGMETPEMLTLAARQYAELRQRAAAFDDAFMADLCRVGGPEYAEFCALAYRQTLACHKLAAGPDGQPLMFSKECFSGGMLGTVDVIYPAAPIFMLLNTDLLKATVDPVFHYAKSGRWKFAYAPHDLGLYPKANGQFYGGKEKTDENQMPVEECGNMLILAAAVAQLDGNTAWIGQHWDLLSRWADYLKQKGLDPENQLCTDDFAGHLAHNANLSVKAILALGCYAKMAQMAGHADEAREYRTLAESFAKQWITMADDGDHFRLAFDKPGTWSQKYNLVWDTLLDLHLFPAEVTAKEVAYYKTRLQAYGLPLDNRQLYTKTDWQVWTATLATSQADFEALMKPVYAFVNQTSKRVPMTDWYWTQNAEYRGFQARSVLGGVFIKMLADPAMWSKWSKQGTAAAK